MSDPVPPIPPATEEYPRRLAAQIGIVQRERVRVERIGNFRLLLFFAIVGIVIAASADVISAHFTWLPIAAFVALVVQSGRASLALLRAERGVTIYEHGIARLEDRWTGTGRTGDALRPESHVYADDLDLFGRGSLFELVSRARTEMGEQTIAAWLLAPAAPDVIRARQEAVKRLTPMLDLREDLAIVAGEVASAMDRDRAAAWGDAPRTLWGFAPWPWIFAAVGVVTTGLILGWLFLAWPMGWALISAAVQLVLWFPMRHRVADVLASADRPTQDLFLVERLFQCLEAEQFDSGLLGEIASGFERGPVAASAAIRQLGRLMDVVESRQNPIFLPVSWSLGLGTWLAYAIERWRAEHGTHLAAWLESLGQLEALLSFSGYAYEHPDDAFPELLDGTPRLEGRSVGHPLLAAEVCVRNDVALGGDAPQAMLVSGSNMSGKSTYLRTVGVAAVFAQAGLPVRAERFGLTPLEVGASIRVTDSIQAGASRFYAEIERLKWVVDLADGERPALFLLDEVLHGTNSHDRRIGAEAVVRALLDRRAIGLVTTHDLALAEIAAASDQLANAHFADQLDKGTLLSFDYRLKPGVVQGSNALALMRSVGLDV